MRDLAPYLLAYGAIAIIAAFIAVTIGYRIELNRKQGAVNHWRNRAIDLSVEKSDAARLRSERARHARRCQIEQRKMG